jgi:hypothetical protein
MSGGVKVMVRTVPVVVLVGAVLLFSDMFANDRKYDVLDRQKIYYGDCASFENPALASLNQVFPYIREYRLIGERKLCEKDPEYWVLLLQANAAFRAAVARVAVSGGYDLVAGTGAVKAIDSDEPIPDVTHLVIAEVQRNPEDKE